MKYTELTQEAQEELRRFVNSAIFHAFHTEQLIRCQLLKITSHIFAPSLRLF
ncbi:hypothetical protein [Candidatus Sarmatiella mevalonica]|uniref:hypothetical protein n=1 Tax=Candidatus Sarmatiella mevalonica TaxID=2770581 RepID=UPI001923F3C7|nr:hypothetical protein [Candidatus Sarmatiella mevalonica]